MPDETKIYVPKVSAKEIVFDSGGSIIKLGCHAETLIAFLRQNVNERGYVNLVISKRRTPSQYGETHSVALDTFKPKQQSSAPSHAPRRNPDADMPPL